MGENLASQFVDSALAELAADNVFRGHFRWTPGRGWLRWDDRRWTAATEVDAAEAVRAWVFRGMHAAAELVSTGQADIELVKKWTGVQSKGRIGSIVALARGMSGIRTDDLALDADPDVLNVANGIVNLRTGDMGPHHPDALCTKIAEGAYEPAAVSPEWNAALNAVPPDIREWLQTRLGQSATGHRPDDDTMFVCFGEGSNGKSTVLGAVLRALGDYAGLIPHRALLADANAHSTELTTFQGLRLALMEETPEEGHLDMHRVKATVGTASITARRIRHDDVTFPITHTMWINTNHRPMVTGADHGTWRRLVAVPWPIRFVGAGKPLGPNVLRGDPGVRRAVADAPTPQAQAAIIAWLVAGARRWYSAGQASPPHPPAVLAATEAWRGEADTTRTFVQDRLVADPRYFITADDMHGEFAQMLAGHGRRPWARGTVNARMGAALAAAGIPVSADPSAKTWIKATDVRSRPPNPYGGPVGAEGPTTGSSARVWRGLRFRTPADDRAAAEGASGS
jgi:putative DNA primase/helicase